MRSKFIVKISTKSDGKFPSDVEIRSILRTFGWEPREVSTVEGEEEKVEKYKAIGLKLFEEMPEVAKNEKDDVIYAGFLSADQTHFVVTRSSDGEITFRLLQPELPKLIQATEKIIRSIEKEKFSNRDDEVIINRSISVYERSHDHIILQGRVVENKIIEALRSNLKDTVVVGLSIVFLLILSVPLSIGLLSQGSHIWFDSAVRVAISVAALFVVSLAGLIITYRDITQTRVVNWNLRRAEQ
jgi:hypothetical protein